MKKVALLILASLLCSTQAAQACGHKRMHRRCRCASVVAQPVSYAPMMVAPASSTPQMAVAPVPAAAPAVAVTPAYDYQPAIDNRPAYYYSYDSSGKLIVSQWMDWVFRGGREAGMPRPPLPIVGLLRRD